MKLNNLILTMSAGALALGMSSCENGDISFPDSDAGVQVYFAYQHPIRTIVLGDITTYDNTRESKNHAFTIYGVSSGSYSGKDIDVEVAVDETLLKGLTLEDGSPLKLMPSDYYTLGGSTLHYGGNFRGGVDVQLQDAFFNDPASIGNTYVIPLVMKSASGEVDGILAGTASQDGALRQDETKWLVAPKDYTLFMVNYINEYEGNYLRRGFNHTHVCGYPAMGPVSITTGDKVADPWDNQFWISSDIPFEEGQKWSLKMKVKADHAATHGTQLHARRDNGGYAYKGNTAIGNVEFTTEWTEFSIEGTFNGEVNPGALPWAPDDPLPNGSAFAFNLNDGDDDSGNTYYFDDIVLIIEGHYGVKENVAGKYVIKSNIGDKANEVIESNYESALVDDIYEEFRHKEFVEKDEVIKVKTVSRLGVQMPVSVPTVDGPVTCNIKLDFDSNNNCTISSASDGFTVTGTGQFKSKSEKLAWGNKDRDGLYLDYTIEYGKNSYQALDTLVVRDRGSVTQIREFKTTYTEE